MLISFSTGYLNGQLKRQHSFVKLLIHQLLLTASSFAKVGLKRGFGHQKGVCSSLRHGYP